MVRRDIHSRINASAFDPRQEPGAAALHTWICAGWLGPRVKDILDDIFQQLPEPFPPEPQPYPIPWRLRDGGPALERARDVLGSSVVETIAQFTEGVSFGESATALQKLLEVNAFSQSIPPPLPLEISNGVKLRGKFADYGKLEKETFQVLSAEIKALPSPAPTNLLASTPFTRTLQLYGCNEHAGAKYYRLRYSFNGSAPHTFSGHSWKVFRWVGSPGHLEVQVVAPDSNGWYEVLPVAEQWLPSHLLLSWPTRSYQNGLYDVSMESAVETSRTYSPGNSVPRPIILI